MTSVLLVLHPKSEQAAALGSTARTWWETRGHEVVLWDDQLQETPDVDIAISLGGDGTMLRTVQLALQRGVPVLGVNLGRMGYLAEVEPTSLESALDRIARGDYRVEHRMVLEVDVETAMHGSRRLLALNEVIVEKTAPGHTIRVGVAIGGRPFLTYVADGLLACTPTGSTAYNLSARGPVVSPMLRAIVLTPVAPHLVFDRSLVLEPDEAVQMSLLDGHPAAAVLDGSRVIPLGAGDSVTCRGAVESARLVTFGDLDFHAVLRSRFGLTDR
ncbi:MAG: NAD(+)/NADH kinase [Acidimicrobiales bacterium]